MTTEQWRAISERLYMLDGAALNAALGLEDDTYAQHKFEDVKALAKALARVSIADLAKLTESL